ncbi:oligosaccharide flippase family protein [Ferruginibacter sp. SUN106]|uniref:oligosaccharide flippase family protein n=1 Tax=Ferruginibacter sp. SUN106 TaxID=2978348 RepID=UPI003D35AAC8
MSNIKKLAGQTMWYGVSSIAARFLNYLITPYLTDVLTREDYGKMSLVYSVLPFLNVLFTYGMETAFFRFSNNGENKDTIYNTTASSILISTLCFGTTLLLFHHQLANFAGVGNYPELIKLSVFIIMIDTLTIIPFAKLRYEGRPVRYAMAKISGILAYLFFTYFFLSVCYVHAKADPTSFYAKLVDTSHNPVYYIVVANLIQAIVTLLFLSKEILAIRFKIDKKLWRQIIVYSMPLIIVGMGGVINETMDRIMLKWWVPGTDDFKETQVGIYSACYKLSILISLFVQAFRMGAEPFFFKQAGTENPQRTYARVMKFFVIIICMMFLVVALYLNVWKFFIAKKLWDGLTVVPILLLANMFLGIYYNLSIWYKLGHKTSAGAYITLTGAAITIAINYIFIRHYSYMACAWATFFCYGSMMVFSFVWGQKEYKVPYPWKKLCAYIVIAVLLFFIHKAIISFTGNIIISHAAATVLLAMYVWFVAQVEKKELAKLPVVGKYFKA